MSLRASSPDRGVIVAERVEVAASLWARFLGLMGRRSLPDGDALWLPGSNGIHMLFMRFPIDALFLGRPEPDGARRVLAARHDLPAWRGVVWYVHRANGTLELPTGTIERSGVAVGDRILLEPGD